MAEQWESGGGPCLKSFFEDSAHVLEIWRVIFVHGGHHWGPGSHSKPFHKRVKNSEPTSPVQKKDMHIWNTGETR